MSDAKNYLITKREKIALKGTCKRNYNALFSPILPLTRQFIPFEM